MRKHGPGPRSKFTKEEDENLVQLAHKYGYKKWKVIAKEMKNKTAKQCRERWTNYLDPKLSFDEWEPEEDELLISKYKELGPKWSTISNYFPTRSVNGIRLRFLRLAKAYKIPLPSNWTTQRFDLNVPKINRPLRIAAPKSKITSVIDMNSEEKESEESEPVLFREYKIEFLLIDH